MWRQCHNGSQRKHYLFYDINFIMFGVCVGFPDYAHNFRISLFFNSKNCVIIPKEFHNFIILLLFQLETSDSGDCSK